MFELIFYIITCNILIFIIGFFGIFINKRNIFMILVSIEVLFLGLNLNFVITAIYLDDIVGHIFVIFILTIITCESAIGLSLLIILYKLKKSIDINLVKGLLLTKF